MENPVYVMSFRHDLSFFWSLILLLLTQMDFDLEIISCQLTAVHPEDRERQIITQILTSISSETFI